MSSNNVPYNLRDRQWDVRVNVQTDEYLQQVLDGIRSEHAKGRFKYILVGGLEIGTKPTQDDYQTRHIHIAAIYNDPIAKSALLKNWNICIGNGYYLVPRNRNLPYSGWRSHHIKEHSKIDTTKAILFEEGELPHDIGEKRAITKRSETEKKQTTNEILKKMRPQLS